MKTMKMRKRDQPRFKLSLSYENEFKNEFAKMIGNTCANVLEAVIKFSNKT